MKEAIVKMRRDTENSTPPVYATQGAAGFDFYANEEFHLGHTPVKVSTGIYLEVPEGQMLLLLPRSGLAYDPNALVAVANSPGLVDSDYRGEIILLLFSRAPAGFVVEKGMRVAQGVLVPFTKAIFEEVDQLTVTDRGTNGFGHSGRF